MNNDNFYPAPTIETVEPEIVTRSPFILGNTKEIGLNELSDMLTPVFSRDNVETISHTEAISTVHDAICTYFDGQEINTDTDTDATYNKFFSRGDYRGHICYEDRYGNPHTDYYTYTPSDKAKAIRSLLLTYVQRKYKSYYDKKKAEQENAYCPWANLTATTFT